MKVFTDIEIAAKKPLQVKKLVLKNSSTASKFPVPWQEAPYSNNNKISTFKRLEELTITDYAFDSFNFSFKNLPLLRSLDISYNDFGYWLYQPREKAGVAVQNANHIPYLAEGFYELKHLEYLNFAGNHLGYVEFPNGALPSLKSLDLSDNARSFILPEYPDKSELLLLNLPTFPVLQSLDLSNNNMPNLPNLGHFTNLEFINLTSNRLKSNLSDLNKFKKIKKLALGFNQFESFPESLNLPELKTLSLSNNNIWWIGESVQKYKQLEELDLSANQLESLPEYFFKMENLVRLNLSFNKLRDLPLGLRKLKKLKWLSIKGNQFSEASIKVFKLEHPGIELIS